MSTPQRIRNKKLFFLRVYRCPLYLDSQLQRCSVSLEIPAVTSTKDRKHSLLWRADEIPMLCSFQTRWKLFIGDVASA